MQNSTISATESAVTKREKRTLEMQLDDIAKQKKQLLERERRLKAKLADDERKKRTKRLIEIGASVESVLGRKIEKSDLPKLIGFLSQQEERGGYFSAAMK
jgi:hypothetical protein